MDNKTYLKQASEEMILRNYSKRTIRSYLLCLHEYFNFVNGTVLPYTEAAVRQFLLRLHEQGKAAQNYNVHLYAIKFFY